MKSIIIFKCTWVLDINCFSHIKIWCLYSRKTTKRVTSNFLTTLLSYLATLLLYLAWEFWLNKTIKGKNPVYTPCLIKIKLYPKMPLPLRSSKLFSVATSCICFSLQEWCVFLSFFPMKFTNLKLQFLHLLLKWINPTLILLNCLFPSFSKNI